MIRGVDDGPDGLNESAFDRAMAVTRPKRKRAGKPAGRGMPAHVPKRTEEVETDHCMTRFLSPQPAGETDILFWSRHFERIDRNESALFGAWLSLIAGMECSTSVDEWGCPSCLAKQALIKAGRLDGISDLFRWIREACRG